MPPYKAYYSMSEKQKLLTASRNINFIVLIETWQNKPTIGVEAGVVSFIKSSFNHEAVNDLGSWDFTAR